MSTKDSKPLRKRSSTTSSSSDVAAFVKKASALAKSNADNSRGRLLFALDATMSRQPTWDLACSLQSQMFDSVTDTDGLDVQLLYFRGFGECRASKWVGDTASLSKLMSGLQCRGGQTQISKVFAHARTEHAKRKINALVFVGDAVEEDVDRLAHKAGELGLLGCPMFVFQEGHDAHVEATFREFARLTKGAYARFDASAPKELAELLRAVAAYATGGRTALRLQKNRSAKTLLEQLR